MQWYRQALAKALNKEIDWDSDSLKLTLHSSAYTPDLDAHAYVSSLTNELATAGGYTSGGFAVTATAPAYTAANSYGTTWAATTAFAVGAIVRPAAGNGFLYQAIAAGTSGSATPAWPTTVGATVTDGGVTWANVGKGIVVVTFAAVTVASGFSAGPFRYAVLSDRTAGTAATQPLIGITDFGSDKTGGGGNFSYTPDPAGSLQLLLP